MLHLELELKPSNKSLRGFQHVLAYFICLDIDCEFPTNIKLGSSAVRT